MNGEAMMHGKDWDGRNPAGWLASEKLDGCRAYWDGKKLWTRQGNEINLPRITAILPRGVHLDGEIWAGRGNFTVARIAVQYGKDTPSVRFVAFDAPKAKGDWRERMEQAKKLWADCVSLWIVESSKALISDMRRIVSAAGEGIVIRKPGEPYSSGRFHHVLKVKPDLI